MSDDPLRKTTHAENFLRYVTGGGVEKVPPSPSDTPLARSTAISRTPITHSNPMRGATVAQEMIPADDEYVWPRDPEPVLKITDEDGDSIQIDHVFVESERGRQVWLTARGDTGDLVQVSLDREALMSLGERLTAEAEDMSW